MRSEVLGTFIVRDVCRTDLNDIWPDQVDFSYVIVSPDLVKGKKKTGQASLTCRQVDDSEGYSWITATFTCKVADAI
ncbi:MAG: hypothetical protein JST80_12495 [Bdellovibrionales bacterium]|nr:hypothetical protein [Bdellovibrionales bacterium]